MIDLKEYPHRRFNALTREWVLVSPHRAKRPWQGQTEAVATAVGASYDPSCYLCPGNLRAGGHRNPPYASTFVFENDFAALLPDTPAGERDEGGLLVARSERGCSRVVCFSPDHSLTLARMTPQQIRPVVDTWAAQFAELLGLPFVNYVQIFENRGEMMGCSNPHPHCQIWAAETLPNEAAKEQSALADYAASRDATSSDAAAAPDAITPAATPAAARPHTTTPDAAAPHTAANRACLLCDYLALERKLGERIVCDNEFFTILVPFWAVWPFETILIPKRHVTGIDLLSGAERDGLAQILRSIGARYDGLFSAPFPYTMGFHQRPAGADTGLWHMHAHYYPPLLRSATVRKFMVGFEMLAEPQRDITPETAAARLRDTPEI
jgi:UDPglucose--hexose-1-phosphate uridylyltransferase